jgi:DNA-binding SARP family transcriptional activator
MTASRGRAGQSQRPHRPHAIQLDLLDGLELRADGVVVYLPMPSQRLVAFLALRSHPLLRAYLAGSLWPEASEHRATGSLRNALWQVSNLGLSLIISEGQMLRMSPAIRVDVVTASNALRRLDSISNEEVPDLIAQLGRDLLPGWYDDWVDAWRRRWTEVRIAGLERIAQLMSSRGQYDVAIEAGLVAVQGDPLRESARRIVIANHLAIGNVAQARREADEFARMLNDELGIQPSSRIDALIAASGTPWQPRASSNRDRHRSDAEAEHS